MAKRRTHRQDEWDAARTELLGLPELSVEKAKGGIYHFYAWNNDLDTDPCPLCGSEAVKVQDLFTKTYCDVIQDGGKRRVINLHYHFYKWRCLNEKCRHIYAKEIGFATKNDRVTHRMEDDIASLVMKGFSYGDIHAIYQEAITRPAVGQIFNRWVRTHEEQRIMQTPVRHLAVLSGSTDKDAYVAFINLDDGIRVLDILYGIDTPEIVQSLKSFGGAVELVITDCNPVIAEAVKDQLPNALHIVPVEYWFKLVTADFADLAREILKWVQVPNYVSAILAPPDKDGLFSFDADRLRDMRPSIAQPHNDYNKLRKIISQRGEQWVFAELVEWIESVEGEFRDDLRATEFQLYHYRVEIEAHMDHRKEVPERLYPLISRLEEILQRPKPKIYSTEVLKARVLYSQDADLEDWRGIPIEDVISVLGDKKRNTEE